MNKAFTLIWVVPMFKMRILRQRNVALPLGHVNTWLSSGSQAHVFYLVLLGAYITYITHKPRENTYHIQCWWAANQEESIFCCCCLTEEQMRIRDLGSSLQYVIESLWDLLSSGTWSLKTGNFRKWQPWSFPACTLCECLFVFCKYSQI